MSRLSVLFTSSEVYPFAKSGGLADVAHSLPRALSSDCDIEVFMPMYRFVDKKKYNITALEIGFDVVMNATAYPVELYGCTYEGLNYCFVYSPVLCERDFLYGPPENGYEDNALRFALFDRAVVQVLKNKDYDIVHLNDWQSGLVPLLMQEEKDIRTKSLFTIHNLAYQGTFDQEVLKELDVDEKYFTMDGIEFYGQMNFMKAAIAYADMITTVSPNYAKEILSADFGCGLEGFLKHHQQKLRGIVNGIDTEHFSPSDDKALVSPYSDLKGKATNKSSYLKERGLKGVRKPLFVFIGRFTWQKGMELLIEALPKIAAHACNIAILGEGEAKYYNALKAIADQCDNVHLEFGYDESLSHRMYAASDFLLMPSLFEPCGLNQLISMHYGSIPVVHGVGGLADTVSDYKRFDAKKSVGYGIVFDAPSLNALIKAVDQAINLYADKIRYNTIAKHNMVCDFSWRESARSYLDLYKNITKKRSHG